MRAADNQAVTVDQTDGLPETVAGHLRDLIDDYETGEGLEVDCAHDADKLECLFQAVEYRDSGHANVGGWIEASRAKLRTKSAQRLADIAESISSQDWHNEAMQLPRPLTQSS